MNNDGMHHHHEHHQLTTRQCDSECAEILTKPQNSNDMIKCTDCKLSNSHVNSMLDDLCANIKSPICDFRKSCQDDVTSLCDPFDLWFSICTYEEIEETHMGRSGCSMVDKYCLSNQAVCGTRPRFDISQASTIAAIREICSSMPEMNGCDQCTTHHCHGDTKLLVSLCSDMPMEACDAIQAHICHIGHQASDHAALIVNEMFGCVVDQPVFHPPMKMYFHRGIHEYFLFESWVPQTKSEYYFCCGLILLFGLVSASLKSYRHTRQKKWSVLKLVIPMELRGTGPFGLLTILCSRQSSTSSALHRKELNSLIARNVERAVLTFVITGIDYTLMLVAMTFNAGFYFAVILSFALGQLLYGHLMASDF